MMLAFVSSVVATVLTGVLMTAGCWYALRHGLFQKIEEEQCYNREAIARLEGCCKRLDQRMQALLSGDGLDAQRAAHVKGGRR